MGKMKKHLFKLRNDIVKSGYNSTIFETNAYLKHRYINVPVLLIDQVFRKLSEDRDNLKPTLKNEYNNKKSTGCTLEGTDRKKAKTSGFRARMATKKGRKIIARRRAKGRSSCCYSRSGSSKN